MVSPSGRPPSQTGQICTRTFPNNLECNERGTSGDRGSVRGEEEVLYLKIGATRGKSPR